MVWKGRDPSGLNLGEELKENGGLPWGGQLLFLVMADQPLNGLAARKLLHEPLPLSRNVLRIICAVWDISLRQLMIKALDHFGDAIVTEGGRA